MNILIAGDDAQSLNILSYVLTQEGYAVTSLVSPAQPDPSWTDAQTDVLILDCNAVTPDLLQRIESARTSSPVAIMLLSYIASETELIDAYAAGIDDCLVKPYSYQLLLAHVNAQLRRARVVPATLVPSLSDSTLRLDTERHTVTLADGQTRQLTNLEFRLLYCLLVNRGHVLTTEKIIEKVWGYSGEGDKNLLKSLISRLRAKVEPSPREPSLVKTVPGVGYMFSPGSVVAPANTAIPANLSSGR